MKPIISILHGINMVDKLSKKYHLVTTTEGCATNLLENASYGQLLDKNEIIRTKEAAEADIIIVNTCAYTTDQENKSINVIEKFKKQFPDKQVIVGGCLTKIAPTRIKELNVDSTFNPGDVGQLARNLKLDKELTEDDKKLVNFFDQNDFKDLTFQHKFLLWLRPVFFNLEKVLRYQIQPLHNIVESAIINEEYFAVTVSQGCAGRCTFCSIKIAKGHVKSRPIEIILHEIETALSNGHTKLWLLGDDIGCYGIDRESDFPTLLDAILKIDKEFQLIINYFEPYFFLKYFDRMKKSLTDKRVINLNLPIQSANKDIVFEMGRDYDPAEVLQKVVELKSVTPQLVMKTNIIVGFPGESFKAYLESVKSVFSFDAILALKFTARPKTRANKYKNQIPEYQKQLRIKFINLAILIRHVQVALKSFINLK